MFGRATIRLGIGPHSSYFMRFFKCTLYIYKDRVSVSRIINNPLSVAHFLLSRIFLGCSFLWPPYVIARAGHYIFALWFFLLSFYLFSSPNLSSRRLDVYHTCPHCVVLVRI